MSAKSELDVLWESPELVAVNKPAGLATIPGRAETDDVLGRIGRQLGLPSSGSDDPRIRVVHRLDKDTSGVILFAKNVEAQRHLSEQFRENQTQKEYLCVLSRADRMQVRAKSTHRSARIRKVISEWPS